MSISGHRQNSDGRLNEKWPEEHARSIRLASHVFGCAITSAAATQYPVPPIVSEPFRCKAPLWSKIATEDAYREAPGHGD